MHKSRLQLSDSDSVEYLNAVYAVVNRQPVGSPLCLLLFIRGRYAEMGKR